MDTRRLAIGTDVGGMARHVVGDLTRSVAFPLVFVAKALRAMAAPAGRLVSRPA